VQIENDPVARSVAIAEAGSGQYLPDRTSASSPPAEPATDAARAHRRTLRRGPAPPHPAGGPSRSEVRRIEATPSMRVATG
jgi:hypothetical protein